MCARRYDSNVSAREDTLSDIPWAPDVIERGDHMRAVLRRIVGLGMIVGAGEMVAIAATVKITLGFDDALLLGLCSVLSGVLLAVVMAVPIAGVSAVVARGDAVRAEASALGWVAGALIAWYLWPAGWALVDAPGRLPSAMAFFYCLPRWGRKPAE